MRLRRCCRRLCGRSSLRSQGNRSNQKHSEERAERSESPTRVKVSIIIPWVGLRIQDSHLPSQSGYTASLDANVRPRVCLPCLTKQSDLWFSRKGCTKLCLAGRHGRFLRLTKITTSRDTQPYFATHIINRAGYTIPRACIAWCQAFAEHPNQRKRRMKRVWRLEW